MNKKVAKARRRSKIKQQIVSAERTATFERQKAFEKRFPTIENAAPQVGDWWVAQDVDGESQLIEVLNVHQSYTPIVGFLTRREIEFCSKTYFVRRICTAEERAAVELQQPSAALKAFYNTLQLTGGKEG